MQYFLRLKTWYAWVLFLGIQGCIFFLIRWVLLESRGYDLNVLDYSVIYFMVLGTLPIAQDKIRISEKVFLFLSALPLFLLCLLLFDAAINAA